MTNSSLIEEFVNEKLFENILKAFRAKEGGMREAILVILNAIPKGKFATPQWINSVLLKAGVERDILEIRSHINSMKRKEPRTVTIDKKTYKVKVKPTIEDSKINNEDNDFFDVKSNGRHKTLYKVRLNEYGKEKASTVFKSIVEDKD